MKCAKTDDAIQGVKMLTVIDSSIAFNLLYYFCISDCSRCVAHNCQQKSRFQFIITFTLFFA